MGYGRYDFLSGAFSREAVYRLAQAFRPGNGVKVEFALTRNMVERPIVWRGAALDRGKRAHGVWSRRVAGAETFVKEAAPSERFDAGLGMSLASR